MMGVFLIKGMWVSPRDLSVSVDEQGKISGSLALDIAYDACIAWAEIALEHRQIAISRMEDRRKAWDVDAADESLRAKTLGDEFHAAAQAVTSAAICMDAFYDHLSARVSISESTRSAWKEKKTARAKQIAETIRLAFKLKPDRATRVRTNLKYLFDLRDRIVHPSSVPLPPRRHPEIGVFTDWRLGTYRGDVADLFVCDVMSVLWDMCHEPLCQTDELRTFIAQFRERIEGLLPEGKPTPADAKIDLFIADRPR